MGQQVGVVEKKSATAGMVRFELNRNLTGSGHERFTAGSDAVGPRPSAELARRLFDTGQVAGVHLYMNVVTVDLQQGCTSDGLFDVMRDLYQYWKPGMVPPAFADQVPADEAGPVAAAAGAPDDGGSAGFLDPRVPALLWERSQAALAKWKAAHGG